MVPLAPRLRWRRRDRPGHRPWTKVLLRYSVTLGARFAWVSPGIYRTIMNRYELMYLVPTKYAEEELVGVISQVRDLIVKHGGKTTFEDNLCKKRLAYPIKQAHQCYYLLTHFDAEPGEIRGLNRELGLLTDVVRHLVVRRSEMTRKTAPMEPTVAPTTQQTQKDELSQQKLADLDRKLDELLTKDII